MSEWFRNNGPTAVIGLLLLLLVYLAIRRLYKNKGNCCCGCKGGRKGCHCKTPGKDTQKGRERD